MTIALKPNVVTLIKDLNGNHVIQKCLHRLSAEHKQFIYNAVSEHCIQVATHRHGCCVLQRCIDYASEAQKVKNHYRKTGCCACNVQTFTCYFYRISWSRSLLGTHCHLCRIRLVTMWCNMFWTLEISTIPIPSCDAFWNMSVTWAYRNSAPTLLKRYIQVRCLPIAGRFQADNPLLSALE